MWKVSENDVEVVFRDGNRKAFVFLLLIPAGFAVKYFWGGDWKPVLMATFMGGVMFFVGAMREQLVFDSVTRTVSCTESFLWHTFRTELIPFDQVTRLTVAPHFERQDGKRGKLHQSGFHMSIDWKAQWGGGGTMLETFDEEADAMREAEGLARKIHTTVERTSH